MCYQAYFATVVLIWHCTVSVSVQYTPLSPSPHVSWCWCSAACKHHPGMQALQNLTFLLVSSFPSSSSEGLCLLAILQFKQYLFVFCTVTRKSTPKILYLHTLPSSKALFSCITGCPNKRFLVTCSFLIFTDAAKALNLVQKLNAACVEIILVQE